MVPEDESAPRARGADLPSLTPTREKIYDTIASSDRPLLVEEIAQQTGISSNTVGPRCSDLNRLGLIEPAGKRATTTGVKAGTWKVVPTDRIEKVRERARKKPKRRKTVFDLPAETQADFVRALLRIDAVNALLLADPRRSRAASRARREARTHAQRRRDVERELKRAEAEGSPLVKFLKAKRLMEDATEALRGMATNATEEAELRCNYGEAAITDDGWDEIRSMAEDHAQLSQAIIRVISGMLGDLDDTDIIDVEVLEDIELELPPG